MLQLLEIKTASATSFLGRETRGALNIWYELIIMFSFLIILIINFLLNRRMGSSVTSLPFIYIMAGMAIMEASRILIFMYDLKIYDIADTTLQAWWHGLFYLAMVLFSYAILQVSRRTKESDLRTIGMKDITIIGLCFVFVVLDLLTPQLANDWFTGWFDGSALDTSGLLHFIAFLLAAILTFQLLTVRRAAKSNDFGKYIASIVPSFIGFLAVMSLNHFWELLTESWAIFEFDEEVIETGEQLFWVVGFLIMVIGYYSLLSSVNRSRSKVEIDVKSIDSPVVKAIIEVLAEHVGTLANTVAARSSQEMGIQISELSKSNISQFGAAVENNTKDLIGLFPSKFLNQTLQKRVNSM